jgi:hypothetical protein
MARLLEGQRFYVCLIEHPKISAFGHVRSKHMPKTSRFVAQTYHSLIPTSKETKAELSPRASLRALTTGAVCFQPMGCLTASRGISVHASANGMQYHLIYAIS